MVGPTAFIFPAVSTCIPPIVFWSVILPAEVINKPKQGFMAPLADWLKQDLKPYALDVLSRDNIRKRGYFDPDYIQGMLRQHFSGKAIFTHQIWALLILELWLRTKES